MATDVYRPADPAENHNCFKDINPKGITGFLHMVEKKEETQGLIRRCSCGTLWILQHYSGNYNAWVKADWKLRWKHRQEGWEGVSNESY